MGIEPTLSAWKAEVLPLNYTRKSLNLRRSKSSLPCRFCRTFFSVLILQTNTTLYTHCYFILHIFNLVEGEGFEPSKTESADLQSAPFGRSGTPPDYLFPLIGAPGEIRTPDPLVRSQILYPTELRAQRNIY
jgi:hypothetical protein